jgi:hypothetical protein
MFLPILLGCEALEAPLPRCQDEVVLEGEAALSGSAK